MSTSTVKTSLVCFAHTAEGHTCPPREICHCAKRGAGVWTATTECMKGPMGGSTKTIICWYLNGNPADCLVFGKGAKVKPAAYLAAQGYSVVGSLPHDLHRQPA